MFEKIKTWVHNIFTEPDNKTICPLRIIAIFGTFQGMAQQAWDFFVNHTPFDLEHFGIGMSAVLVAAGAALGIKKDSPTGGQ